MMMLRRALRPAFVRSLATLPYVAEGLKAGVKGPYKLPALPYAGDALEPAISAETLGLHHGKHHQTYVTKLNAALEEKEQPPLEDLIETATGGVFNNAAQIWNHTFYWHSMAPGGGGEPTGAIKAAIDESFGDFATFKAEFSSKAALHFGSGWVWLVRGDDGKLTIHESHDAGNPLRDGAGLPLLTCDVWEHAYYVDRRNVRPDYVEAWWSRVNWDFANETLAALEK